MHMKKNINFITKSGGFMRKDLFAFGACIILLLTPGCGKNKPTDPAAQKSLIAFHSDRNGNIDICLVRPDGTGEERLTDDPAVDRSPDWSRDGSSILFISERAPYFHDAFSLLPATGLWKSITYRREKDPGPKNSENCLSFRPGWKCGDLFHSCGRHKRDPPDK